MQKHYKQNHHPIYNASRQPSKLNPHLNQSLHTRFVPLCKAQTESPMSTLSPRENGSPPPFAIADPMADLRKSMAVDVADVADVAVADCLGD
jgi:hypothetical protein